MEGFRKASACGSSGIDDVRRGVRRRRQGHPVRRSGSAARQHTGEGHRHRHDRRRLAVTGIVTTTGIAATAAHIHMAAAGKNGPVIVPMVKSGDNGWTFPPGAKLNPDQMKAFKAGDLYVNVHSAANPGGEIRGQLK